MSVMHGIFITIRSSILAKMIYTPPYGHRKGDNRASMFLMYEKGMKIEGWKILKGNEMQKKNEMRVFSIFHE